MAFAIPQIDCSRVAREVGLFLEKAVGESGVKGVVLGLSGGLDSSVVAYLASNALGPKRVKALIMPDSGVTPRSDVDDAWLVAETLKIEAREIDIAPMCRAMVECHPYRDASNVVAAGNVKARVRMTLLYYAANTLNMLVCGSGDKSEILIGYFTKYGDGGADILPIGDLYKTDVRRLARHLGVPEGVASKPSSPRLWPGQTAEGELGMSYEVIDPVLYLVYERGFKPEEASERLNVSVELVKAVMKRVERTKHKRAMPPFPAVSHLRVFE